MVLVVHTPKANKDIWGALACIFAHNMRDKVTSFSLLHGFGCNKIPSGATA